MSKFNQCEAFFEIEVEPDRLRAIAAEIEAAAKGEYFQKGQVVRFKIDHRVALVHRPTKVGAGMPLSDDVTRSE